MGIYTNHSHFNTGWKTYFILSALCLLCFFRTGQAEGMAHDDFFIRHYTDEDGLLQNSVENIVKDESGNIWMSTQNGLVKFDGQKFRIFLKKELGTASDRIMALSGFPYMKGLYAQNVSNELLWIQNGTARLVQEDEKIYQQYMKLFNTNKSRNAFGKSGYIDLGEGVVKSILRFNDTSRYVLMEENILSFYKHQQLQYIVTLPMDEDEGMDYSELVSFDDELYYAKDNSIYWIAKEGARTVSLYLDGVKDKRTENVKYRLFLTDTGSLRWFVTDGEKLYKIEKIDRITIHATTVVEDFSFAKNNIRAVLFDEASGVFYLGSITNGMYQLIPKRFNVMINEEKTSNVYYAQLEFKKGYLLTGTGEVFDIQSQKKMNIKPDVSTTGWIYINDNQGRIWCRTNRVVHVLDSANLKVLKSFRFGSGIGGMGYNAQEDAIYLGGTDVPFFKKIKAGDFLTTNFQDLGNLRGFATLVRFDSERLLIATERGLYFYNPATNEKKIVPGTNGMYIRNMFRNHSENGTFWIMIEGRGVYKFHNEELIRLPLDKNEYLLFAHSIVDDGLGNFWISCNKGLFRIRKSEWENYTPGISYVAYQYFNRSSGFNTNEFNGGANTGQMLSNGMISFSSMDGVVIFDPKKIPEQKINKNLVVNRVLNGSEILNVGDTIVWQNRNAYLRIELSIPYFGASEDVYFVYALNDNPPVISNDGWIQFNSLSAGTHLIQAFVPISGNKKVRKKIIIQVPPGWYESSWFYILIITALLYLIFLLVRYNIRRLKNENNLLEEAVGKRTKELENAVQILRESESRLNKELYFQQSLNSNVAHNIKTPLRYLKSSMGRFHQMLLKQDNESNKNESKRIFDATEELYNSTVQFITYMKAANKLGNPQIERMIIRDVAQESVEFYRKFLDENTIKIINHIDEKYIIDSPPDFFKLMMSNFLDNSIKHAKADVVELYSQIRNGELCIVVKDNGVGIPPEYVDMFNEYFQLSSNTSLRDVYVDIGIGYFTIKEMLPFVGAKIEFSENVEAGAEIKIVFKKFMEIT